MNCSNGICSQPKLTKFCSHSWRAKDSAKIIVYPKGMKNKIYFCDKCKERLDLTNVDNIELSPFSDDSNGIDTVYFNIKDKTTGENRNYSMCAEELYGNLNLNNNIVRYLIDLYLLG